MPVPKKFPSERFEGKRGCWQNYLSQSVSFPQGASTDWEGKHLRKKQSENFQPQREAMLPHLNRQSLRCLFSAFASFWTNWFGLHLLPGCGRKRGCAAHTGRALLALHTLRTQQANGEKEDVKWGCKASLQFLFHIFSLIKTRFPAGNTHKFLTCLSYCYSRIPELLISSFSWVKISQLEKKNTPIRNFSLGLIESATPSRERSVWGPNLAGENGSKKGEKN